MAKAVILKTDEGVRLLGAMQCCNGSWFDADGCYDYCQSKTDWMSSLQARKLIEQSTALGHEKAESGWYKNRGNFVDVDIPFECKQEYEDELIKHSNFCK